MDTQKVLNFSPISPKWLLLDSYLSVFWFCRQFFWIIFLFLFTIYFWEYFSKIFNHERKNSITRKIRYGITISCRKNIGIVCVDLFQFCQKLWNKKFQTGIIESKLPHTIVRSNGMVYGIKVQLETDRYWYYGTYDSR